MLCGSHSTPSPKSRRSQGSSSQLQQAAVAPAVAAAPACCQKNALVKQHLFRSRPTPKSSLPSIHPSITSPRTKRKRGTMTSSVCQTPTRAMHASVASLASLIRLPNGTTCPTVSSRLSPGHLPPTRPTSFPRSLYSQRKQASNYTLVTNHRCMHDCSCCSHHESVAARTRPTTTPTRLSHQEALAWKGEHPAQQPVTNPLGSSFAHH